MTITIAAIETDAANLFHAAIARAKSFMSVFVGAADAVAKEANALAPTAAAALAVVAPQDAAALAAVTGLINLVDGSIDAAGAAVSGGVTLTLPGELAAIWQKAKAGLIAFESTI